MSIIAKWLYEEDNLICMGEKRFDYMDQAGYEIFDNIKKFEIRLAAWELLHWYSPYEIEAFRDIINIAKEYNTHILNYFDSNMLLDSIIFDYIDNAK